MTTAEHHILLHFPMPDPAWNVPPTLVEGLRAQFPHVSLYWYDGTTPLDPAMAAKVDIYFTHVPDRTILHQLPNVRWCHTSAIQWVPYVDPALLQAPCEFTVGRGTFAPWVAAQVMATLQQWRVMEHPTQPVAIIGLGGNGLAIARELHAQGVRVWGSVRSAYGRRDPHVEWFTDTPTLCSHLHEVAGVIITAPLTCETSGLVNAHFFARHAGARWFVNTGRPQIVDSSVLQGALDTKLLTHVAVDDALPPVHPWRTDARITQLPHVHPGLPGIWEAAFARFAEQLHRYLRNEPLHHVLNRTLQY